MMGRSRSSCSSSILLALASCLVLVASAPVPLVQRQLSRTAHTRHPHNNAASSNSLGGGTGSSSILLSVLAAHRRSTRADSSRRAIVSNMASFNASGASVALRKDIISTIISSSTVSPPQPPVQQNKQQKQLVKTYSEQHVKLVLDCAVHINFSTSVWFKDGQIVQTILKDNINNKRVSGHRFLVDGMGNLLIDNVRLEDDGMWQCEAEDALGFVVTGKPVQLTVLDPPRKPYLLIDNRILDPGNLFIPVKENADLTVSCVVDSGNPRPTLTWELVLGSAALLDAPPPGEGGPNAQNLNFTESVREQRVGARSDVRLERVVRGHHNATFTCVVNHVALRQPMNVSLLLDVQYTPSFGISRMPDFGIPIREGMPVWLRCDVDANPSSLPIWQKDDAEPPVQQTPGGYLNFSEIRREHSGWYKCMSRHLLGTFSSIGYFLNVRYDVDVTQEPEFDVLSSTGRQQQQLEVDLGGAVQLACPTGTTGCWSRLDPATGRLEPLGASQELRLDRVLYQEAGEYMCVAPERDSVRRLEALRTFLPAVNVSVSGPPMVFPSNRSVTAVYGQPLTLSMDFCSNPPYDRVLWLAMRQSVVIRPGEATSRYKAYMISNSSTPHCHQAVLLLSSATDRDAGEYSLVVRSPAGLGEGFFVVNMTYASGFVVDGIGSPPSSAVITRCWSWLPIMLIVVIVISRNDQVGRATNNYRER